MAWARWTRVLMPLTSSTGAGSGHDAPPLCHGHTHQIGQVILALGADRQAWADFPTAMLRQNSRCRGSVPESGVCSGVQSTSSTMRCNVAGRRRARYGQSPADPRASPSAWQWPDRRRRALVRKSATSPCKRFAAQQRRIAVGDQNGIGLRRAAAARPAGRHGQCPAACVCSTKRTRSPKIRLHLLLAVADDHHRRLVDHRFDGAHGPVDHRATQRWGASP